MKFQLLSDLHLELGYDYKSLVPKADILFLAGDIGHIDRENFKEFFDYVSLNWKICFYVLGNHEYYDLDYVEAEDRYSKFFEDYININLMIRKKITYEGIDILGTTLWSKPVTERTINDFNNVFFMGEYISVKDMITFHNQDLEWIKENYDPSRKSIILTHFQTTKDPRSLNILYDSSFRDHYYYNNIDFRSLNQLLCISGHSHFSFNFEDNFTRYLSNQKGCPEEYTKYKDDIFEF